MKDNCSQKDKKRKDRERNNGNKDKEELNNKISKKGTKYNKKTLNLNKVLMK